MWAVARWLPSLSLEIPRVRLVAWSLVALGLAVAAAGVATFRLHQTTVNPLTPDKASTLVQSGIFRFTRNPMYVGMTIVLAGIAVGMQHALALSLVPLLPLYLRRFQIEPEERAMAALFGDTWREYARRVPRWL